MVFSVIGVLVVQKTAYKLLEDNKEDILLQIKSRIKPFSYLLHVLEQEMKKHAEKKILSIYKDLIKRKEFKKVTARELKDLALKHKVSEIYLINKKGIIFNTSYKPDFGLDLFATGSGFKKILKSIYGSGKVFSFRLSIANETGARNTYHYFSPKGSNYIFEISLDIKDFARLFPRFKKYYEYLFYKFFQSIEKQNKYVEHLDLFQATKTAQWSLLYEGKKVNLPQKAIDSLRKGNRIQVKDGKLLRVYLKIKSKNLYKETGFMNNYVELVYNYSLFYNSKREILYYLFASALIIVVLSYLFFSRLFVKYFLNKVVLINKEIEEIRAGNYGHEINISGNDELSNIGINVQLLAKTVNEKINELQFVNKEKQKLGIYLQSIMDKVPDSIIIIDTEGNIADYNESCLSMYGYDDQELSKIKAQELSGKKFSQKVANRMLDFTFDKGFLELEWVGRKKGGEIFPIAVRLLPLVLEDIEYIMVIVTDITRWVSAEKRLQNSLKEKEVLIKEVHHRVKNNFQIINALLYLQSQQVSDETCIKILQESQNRIHSMALIHQKLYQTKNISKIDFREYLEKLVEDLINTYRMKKNIFYFVDIDPIDIDVETAVSLGLMINELVVNALKYAFEGKDSGNILISFKLAKDQSEKIILVVQDNGIGIDSELDLNKSESLGWALVNSLCTQLKGAFTIDKNNGLKFTFEFPKEFRNHNI